MKLAKVESGIVWYELPSSDRKGKFVGSTKF